MLVANMLVIKHCRFHQGRHAGLEHSQNNPDITPQQKK